jgi:HSP20 family protein
MKLEELKDMLTFPLQHRYASSFDLFDKLEQQLYSSVRTPAGEIFEEKDKYIIKLELPGVEKDTIKVKATDRTLSISAERTEPKETKENLISEFRYGTWSRTFHFQNGLNRDDLKATYKDGILEVIANKAQTHTEVTVKIED